MFLWIDQHKSLVSQSDGAASVSLTLENIVSNLSKSPVAPYFSCSFVVINTRALTFFSAFEERQKSSSLLEVYLHHWNEESWESHLNCSSQINLHPWPVGSTAQRMPTPAFKLSVGIRDQLPSIISDSSRFPIFLTWQRLYTLPDISLLSMNCSSFHFICNSKSPVLIIFLAALHPTLGVSFLRLMLLFSAARALS